MSSLQSALGYRVRNLRKSQGLSQERLGERANLHNTYIGAIERGERNPSVKTLEKITRALNIEVVDLFKFMEQDTSPAEERTKAEIFALLEHKEAKTLNLVLSLIKSILSELRKFTE